MADNDAQEHESGRTDHRVPRAARLTAVSIALALVVTPFVTSGFRGADGIIPLAILPVAAGIAVIGIAFGIGTTLAAASRWSALFLLSQASSLLLIDAGKNLHYAHLRPWSDLWAHAPLAVSILMLQAVLVGTALLRRGAGVWRWVRDALGPVRALLILVVLIACSATVNADVSAYLHELALGSALQLVGLGNLVLVGLSVPLVGASQLQKIVDRVLGVVDSTDPDNGGADRFAWGAAGLVTAATAILCLTAYERHPHVQDEVKYLLQARYFADGVLALPIPPAPKAFALYLMDVGKHGWYSVVPPGWSAVLALGVVVGAVWLVNPILAGVNVVLAYVLLRSLYDRRTARLTTILLCLSPMFLFLGMSFMAHQITLTCALLGALGVQRARRTGSLWAPLLGGAAVGFSATVRQLDGLIVALALGLWCLGMAGRRVRLLSTVALVAGTVLGVAPLLPYNAYFTGKGTRFPIMEYHDRLFGPNANAYGFGPDRGMGWALDPNPGHSMVDAAINANLNATTMNVELFGWGIGSLLLLAYLVARGPLKAIDKGMLFVVLLTIAAYVPNYFSGGPDFGARYWFPMFLPLVVLTARGIRELARRVGPGGGIRVAAAVASLTLGGTFVFIPWRSVDKYYHYLGMRADLRAMSADPANQGSLVLVRGKESPDYLSAAIYNPLDWQSTRPLFAHAVDDSVVGDVLRAYPERPVVIIEGPSITHDGYHVVERVPSARLLLDRAPLR